MNKVYVDSVVCDYGVYEDGKLIIILNSRHNAELIRDIIKADNEHKIYEYEVE